MKNNSNIVKSDNDLPLVPDNNLPVSSASNLFMALTPVQSPSTSPSPTLSDHPNDDQDDHNDLFHDLVGIDDPIGDDLFGLLDQDEEIHSKILDFIISQCGILLTRVQMMKVVVTWIVRIC